MGQSNRRRYRRWVLWSMLSACLLLLVTWAVSTKWSLDLALKTTRGGGGLNIKHGVIHLIWDRKTHFFNYDQEFSTASVPFAIVAPPGKNYTFAWQPFSGDFKGRMELRFPMGYLIFVGLACALYYHWSAWIEYPLGHCTHCGYDLSGADHECCPECGAACEGEDAAAPARPPRTSWVKRTLVLVAITGALPTAAWWMWKLTPVPGQMTVQAGSVTDSSDALDVASDFLTSRNESPEDYSVQYVTEQERAWYVFYYTPSYESVIVEISKSGVVRLIDLKSALTMQASPDPALIQALTMSFRRRPPPSSQPLTSVIP